MSDPTTRSPVLDDLAREVAASLEREQYVEQAVDLLLRRAVELGASDVLLEPGAGGSLRIRYRINGRFHPVLELPERHAERVTSRIKVLAEIPVYVKGRCLEGRLEVAGPDRTVEVRASFVPVVKGERGVLRLLDPIRLFKPLEGLGFDPEVARGLEALLARDQGLVVLAGPTSSGKTTTLYALLDRVAERQGATRQVLLVEDPVEFPLERIPQVEVSEINGLGFEEALRGILRQDPEVIGIGEIRDPVTARIAVRAALTGHLVLTTVHAGRPGEVPARLRELGVDRRLLAGALAGILTQRLAPVECEVCRGQGCPDCLHTGTGGRTARGDLVVADGELRRRILDREVDHG